MPFLFQAHIDESRQVRAIRAWMGRHASDYVDPETGQVNTTDLIDRAAYEFGLPVVGPTVQDLAGEAVKFLAQKETPGA